MCYIACMKHLLFTAILLIFGLTVSAQTNTTVKIEEVFPIPKEWKKIDEPAYEMSYPADWELDTSGGMGTTFYLYSPVLNEEDTFRENINLIIQDVSSYDIGLADYTKITLEQIKTLITDGKVLTNSTQSRNEKDYQRLIYNGKQGVFDLTFAQYFWVFEDEAYVLKSNYFSAQIDLHVLEEEKEKVRDHSSNRRQLRCLGT